MSNDPQKALRSIFAADRDGRRAEDALLANKPNVVIRALRQAVADAIALCDRDEAEMRLIRLSDLCAQLPGPEMVDALIDILDEEEPPVRVAAAEALLDVAYSRYAEVARSIERALDGGRRGPVMAELPAVLAEVGEPSALPLLKRFLDHAEADAVAAAIESMSTLGDPAAVEVLRPLVDDKRRVEFPEFEDETGTTIGQLAREVIEMFDDA